MAKNVIVHKVYIIVVPFSNSKIFLLHIILKMKQIIGFAIIEVNRDHIIITFLSLSILAILENGILSGRTEYIICCNMLISMSFISPDYNFGLFCSMYEPSDTYRVLFLYCEFFI